ncbi:MAG: lytic transglycosylase domain-containing protein [Actinomycetia bacterium]|jgi:membrane protein involved in colicin uptake|nr:lytic transglycosylase domain-containing protein [Actinomycetes bacterium]
MNRISIRGIGLAAASVATLSLAVGATSAAADAPTTSDVAAGTPVLPALSHNAGLAEESAAAAAFAQRRAAAVKAAQLKASAAKAAREKAAREKAARAKAVQRATRAVNRQPVSAGSARAIGKSLAASRGWTGQQWVCLDNLFTRESGWRTSASNGSGAYGIPQALPGSKMSAFGSDWRTNPTTQIRWGLSYISGRYGTPCAAWNHFQSRRWY